MYELRPDPPAAAGGEPVRLFEDAHELLADAVMRAAGGVRLLRRLVDPERECVFAAGEMRLLVHELEDLRAGLDEEERALLAAILDRLSGLAGWAESAGTGLRGTPWGR